MKEHSVAIDHEIHWYARRKANPMTLKEQLIKEIEALPSDRLAEALALIQSLQTKPSTTSAKSFLAHLKTIGTWSGDDLGKCLEAVQNSQGQAQFDYSPNPFE